MPIKKITGTIESILTEAVQSKENPFKNMITDFFTDIKRGKVNNTEDVKSDLPRTNFVSAEKSYDDIFKDWTQRVGFSFSQGDFTGEFLTSTLKLVSFGAPGRPNKGMAFCYADSHGYSGVSLIVFTNTGENLNEWILAVTNNNFTSATPDINATLYQHSCLLNEDVNTLTNLDSICQDINNEDIAALIKILLVPQENETVVSHSVLDALNEKFNVKAIAHSPRDLLTDARVSALKDNKVASGAGESKYHQNSPNPTTEPLLSDRYQRGSLNRTRCHRSNARLMACLFIFPVVIMALLNNENHHLDDKIQPWLESVHQPWERGAIVGALIGSGLLLMVGGILQISQQCHRKPSSNQSSSEAPHRNNHPLNYIA